MTTSNVVLKGIAVAIGISLPVHAQTLVNARRLFDEHRYAEARTELRAIAATNRLDAEGFYYLGRIAAFLNEGDAAVKYFEKAVDLDPNRAAFHAALGNAVRDITPYVSKLRMPFNARKLKNAYERAVELDPNSVDGRFGVVQYLASAPRAMGGNKERARVQAAELSKRNPMRGAMARAFIEEMLDNKAAMESAYRDAVAAAPDSLTGYEALSLFLAEQGRADEAFAVVAQYANRRKDDRLALFHVGRVAAISGSQTNRGEQALKEFLAAPPPYAPIVTLAGAHHRLGQLAERRGDHADARQNYERAMQLNAHSPARRALQVLGRKE